MGLSETLNYVIFDNPISHGVIDLAKLTVENPVSQSVIKLTVENPVSQGAINIVKSIFNPIMRTDVVSPQVTVITEHLPLYQQVGEHGPFVRIAGLLGASAVALGAYGAHRKYPKDRIDELKPAFETANRIHFFHTLALFGVPFCRNPKLTGALFIIGTALFSGTCYYKAFTGKDNLTKLAPVGGTILIFAWISLAV